MTEPIPAWMRQLLIDKGVLSESGLSRKVKIMRHKKCGLPTLAGFDADRCALDAWCDLGQLSGQGEVLALLDGRRTYEMWHDRLNYRDHWTIKSRPAHSIPVFASHRCEAPIPASWCVPAATDAAKKPTTNDEQGVPF